MYDNDVTNEMIVYGMTLNGGCCANMDTIMHMLASLVSVQDPK